VPVKIEFVQLWNLEEEYCSKKEVQENKEEKRK
jgi:hypothetical protein